MNIEKYIFVILGAVLVGVWYRRIWLYERDLASPIRSRSQPQGRSVVWISPSFLPALILLIPPAYFIVAGPERGFMMTQGIMIPALLVLSAYFGLLLALLPLLRRFFSARACATLWVLPVFMFYPGIWSLRGSYMPVFVLRVPETALIILGVAWAAGFLAVMLWSIATHLRFRREVLRDARAVTDELTLAVFDSERYFADMEEAPRLLTGPNIRSPMALGLTRRSRAVLLPERGYSGEELELIFRHELRHIQRRDIGTRLMLSFCTAFCWFNPLMWAAVRRAAADLELSCDEMVTNGLDDARRSLYAGLILSSSGDGRGFTTCLSASAGALRYRLAGIVKPKKKLPGTVLVAAVTACLIMCCGVIAVSGESGTAGELIFGGEDVSTSISGVTLMETHTDGSVSSRGAVEADEEALAAYIASLPVSRVESAAVSGAEPGRSLSLSADVGVESLLLIISSHRITVSKISEPSYRSVYILDTPMDWAQIDRWAGRQEFN